MHHSTRLAALAAAALAAGCDLTTPFSSAPSGQREPAGGGLSVSPATIAFDVSPGGPLPAARAVTARVTDARAAEIAAGFAGAPPDWLAVGSFSQAGTGWTLPLQVTTTALPAGIRQATLRIWIVDAGGATLAQHAVTVTLSVTVRLAASPAQLAFDHTVGAGAPADQTLQLTGQGIGWQAASDRPWLLARAASGTAPGDLPVGVDPAGLAPGTHTGAVTLTPGAGGGPPVTVPVELRVALPALSVTPAALTPGGASGRDLSPAELSMSLPVSGTVPFTATADVPWIALAPAAGEVGASPVTVTASWDPGALAPGTHTGTITLAATVAGQSVARTVPVTLEVAARRLLADDDGVALASMPGLARTSRTLRIADNVGAVSSWTAASSAPWLTVTAAGTTPGELVLTAEPAGLAADALHEATVTITAGTAGVEPETVKVGLWVGAAAPEPSVTVPVAYTTLAVDPVRPYAYVHAGGPDLTVRHLYTGAVVHTIAGLAPALGQLAVTTDGATLYVSDATHARLVPVALPGFTPGTPLPLPGAGPIALAATHTNGRHLVLTESGDVVDADAGVVIPDVFGGGWYGHPRLTASRDGRRFARQDSGLSPSGYSVFALDWADGEIHVAPVTSGSAGSNGEDVALSADGVRLYAACGGGSGPGYDFGAYDVSVSPPVALPTLDGAPYPNNVEVADDGRIFAGAAVYYGEVDLWVYAPGNATALATYRLGGYARNMLPRGLGVSGDGLRAVAITDDPAFRLVTAGP